MTSYKLTSPKFGSKAHVDNTISGKAFYKISSEPTALPVNQQEETTTSEISNKVSKEKRSRSSKKDKKSGGANKSWDFDGGYGVKQGKWLWVLKFDILILGYIC